MRCLTAIVSAMYCIVLTGCIVEENSNLRRANTSSNNTLAIVTNATAEAPSSPEPTTTPALGSEKARSYLFAVEEGLDQRPRAALQRINGIGRRMLAVRGYLRSSSRIASRWAWTDEELRQFTGTAEYSAMMAAVENVRRIFAEMNPGYELRVNTEVRTLDEQLEKWNSVSSVERASEGILSGAELELMGSAYPESPSGSAVEKFRIFLRSFVPNPQPTVAAPGLSPHGQLRAFDFVVEKDGEIVAGTRTGDAKTAWDDAGWTKKVNQAVLRGSDRMTGPLQSPYEPWHYNYEF